MELFTLSRQGIGCHSPFPSTTTFRVTHLFKIISPGCLASTVTNVRCLAQGPRIHYKVVIISQPRIHDLDSTHCAPLVRNSSPNATPRALINLLLNVEAALIPVGNPVTFFTGRNPAGPSCKQIEGMPKRGTALVSPTQRPADKPIKRDLLQENALTLRIQLACADHNT